MVKPAMLCAVFAITAKIMGLAIFSLSGLMPAAIPTVRIKAHPDLSILHCFSNRNLDIRLFHDKQDE